MTLPGFWHGAAALSGRLDLSILRQHIPDPAQATDNELSRWAVSGRHIHRLRQAQPIDDVGDWIGLSHPEYPPKLGVLPFAPPVLFYRGSLDRLREPSVAIVGARRSSQRARDTAAALARDLAQSGLTIVSGLAYGVDESAHRAAPSKTIAVLGQGLAQPLSRRQSGLVEEIIRSGGLVVTEFLPSTPASRRTFPQRNRVISGLSRGTIVVEATLQSGSLGTARHALSQGREVMAVPGHPMESTAQGCNHLLADGAALIRDADDVLSTLSIDRQTLRREPITNPQQLPLIEALRSGESVDHVVTQSGLDLPTVVVLVDALELTGHVVRLPGERLQLRAWS